MNKTSINKSAGMNNRMTVNSETLANYLDCGRATAVKIGEAAGAKIQIGKRVLWNTEKVKQYLDGITSE